ncbi:hypothetical protein B296_00015377 [Ensete ventricosum]|uniref:Uncharacterized protein n=1 Tax=Ensete ventricosum TaxID=4639 RepID=A0A426ZFA3_ENSVE|nr:hypothetical protein B296_00015377 [Ensete ventricosum]
MGSRTSTVFVKKHDECNDLKFPQSHAQSRVSISFLRTVLDFKILAIPNVLSHGKSYEHSFTKEDDSLKLYAKSRTKSSFD